MPVVRLNSEQETLARRNTYLYFIEWDIDDYGDSNPSFVSNRFYHFAMCVLALEDLMHHEKP